VKEARSAIVRSKANVDALDEDNLVVFVDTILVDPVRVEAVSSAFARNVEYRPFAFSSFILVLA